MWSARERWPGRSHRCDGPLLRAIRDGSWVLLDELNLANQSVLEGLNAVLDHRAEVFVPELSATFRCAPGFRLFAAQNPLQEVSNPPRINSIGPAVTLSCSFNGNVMCCCVTSAFLFV